MGNILKVGPRSGARQAQRMRIARQQQIQRAMAELDLRWGREGEQPIATAHGTAGAVVFLRAAAVHVRASAVRSCNVTISHVDGCYTATKRAPAD